MSSLEERIKQVEEEIKKTPVNKATEAHLAKLKAKLARLREELELNKAKKKASRAREGVKKTGDATVVLVGPPSVGKSSLLNKLTDAESKTGDYAFTTTTIIPGMMEYKGAKIQFLDIPGLISNAASGVGGGKEILSYVRMGDILLIMVDVYTYTMINEIMKELYAAGIRINESPPKVKVVKKDGGSIQIYSRVNLTNISEEMIKSVLHEFKIHNAEVVVEEDITVERFIDALARNRAYLKGLVVVNKIDMVGREERAEIEEWLKKKFDGGMDYILVSVETGEGLEKLKEMVYKLCDFIRIYTKKPGEAPNLKEAMIMKRGSTVRDVCEKIRSDYVERFKFARVFGSSVKFDGQRVGLDHVLEDGDIVELNVSRV